MLVFSCPYHACGTQLFCEKLIQSSLHRLIISNCWVIANVYCCSFVRCVALPLKVLYFVFPSHSLLFSNSSVTAFWPCSLLPVFYNIVTCTFLKFILKSLVEILKKLTPTVDPQGTPQETFICSFSTLSIAFLLRELLYPTHIVFFNPHFCRLNW